MIIKSFEINKKIKNLLTINTYLIYGENIGLKKDIKESIVNTKSEKNEKIESLTFYENDIIGDENNFYNAVYSGSLFSNKKIITVNNGTDKITKHIENLISKHNFDSKSINENDLFIKKIFKKSKGKLKLLNVGELSSTINIEISYASKKAIETIENLGGKVKLIDK